MTAGRAVEPVAAVLALRVGQTLFFLAFGALPVHLAVVDVFFEDQAALGTDLGIPAMIRGFTARRGADIDGVTVVAPVLAARHLFTYRALIHQHTSRGSLPTANHPFTR